MPTRTSTHKHTNIHTHTNAAWERRKRRHLHQLERIVSYVSYENSNFVIHDVIYCITRAKNVESRLRSFVMLLFYFILNSFCSQLVVYDINSRYMFWRVSFFLWAVVVLSLLLAGFSFFFVAHFRYGTSELHRFIHLDLICYVCCESKSKCARAHTRLCKIYSIAV